MANQPAKSGGSINGISIIGIGIEASVAGMKRHQHRKREHQRKWHGVIVMAAAKKMASVISGRKKKAIEKAAKISAKEIIGENDEEAKRNGGINGVVAKPEKRGGESSISSANR